MKNIVVENTIYSLFLYMLLKETWIKDIFIVDDKKLYDLLKSENKVYLIKKLVFKQNPFKYYYEKLNFVIFLIKKGIFLNSNVSIYGDSNMFQLFFIKRNMYIIEDGAGNYNRIKIEKSFIFYLKKIIRLENFNFLSDNEEKWANKIYLTGLAPIPEEIKDKVEIINLKELWNKKTEEEKIEILELFNFSLEKVEILKNKKEILFTQPLSEDRVISEEEKIDLYRKILENYDKKKVVLKKHPREKTNYKEYFPDVEIIEENFPAELLGILGIKFEKAITIFSTAALTVEKNVKVDFYGSEIHPKILERFGSMDSIIKRNAFLKKEIDE